MRKPPDSPYVLPFQKDRSFKLLFSDEKYFRALTEFILKELEADPVPENLLEELQPYSTELVSVQENKSRGISNRPEFHQKMTDIARSVCLSLENGSRIRLVFVYEEQSRIDKEMLFRTSEYILGQVWANSSGDPGKANLVLLTVVNMSFNRWTSKTDLYEALGLSSEKTAESPLLKAVSQFLPRCRYNVISPLVMPEENLEGMTEELKLIFLAIRYSKDKNDQMVDLIRKNSDFFGNLSLAELGFICVYGSVSEEVIKTAMENQNEEGRFNMCNAIQYYVEQSNMKVAAETAARVSAEVAAETAARVRAETAAEFAEKALQDRNRAIFRLFNTGSSVQTLADAYGLSESEIERIIAGQESC